MSYGPFAVGRKDGVVVFVPLAAPGDELKVRVTEVFDRYIHAEILEILKPSAQRKDPICAVFGRCGGCDWQHLKVSEQRLQKQKIVQDFLLKSLGPTARDFAQQPLEVVASPQDFHYRNRVQLKAQDKKLGFFQRGTHSIVDIEDCPLLDRRISQEIPKLKKKLGASSDLERIELSLLKDGQVSSSQAENLLEGEGFSQVNEAVNELILQCLFSWLDSEIRFSLDEFYAGSGNFSFPLLERFPQMKLRAVEWHAKSVQRAQNRLREAQVSPKKALFYCAAVEDFLRRHPVSSESVVFLDPPRSGAHEFVIRSLAAARPRRLLYLSCDPASLARDLKLLQKSSPAPWTLRQAVAFDMFPQTHHVETLVELSPALSP